MRKKVKKMYSILIVEDEDMIRRSLQFQLQNKYSEAFVVAVESYEKFFEVFNDRTKLEELVFEKTMNPCSQTEKLYDEYREDYVENCFIIDIACVIVDMIQEDENYERMMGLNVLECIKEKKEEGKYEFTQIVIHSARIGDEELAKLVLPKNPSASMEKIKLALSEKYNVIVMDKLDASAANDLYIVINQAIYYHKLIHNKNLYIYSVEAAIDGKIFESKEDFFQWTIGLVK